MGAALLPVMAGMAADMMTFQVGSMMLQQATSMVNGMTSFGHSMAQSVQEGAKDAGDKGSYR